MKKLLNLLSVITITATAFPTTIAVISYEKKITIKNNYINYKQINNLKNLIRKKRQTNKPMNFKKDIHDFITVLDLGNLRDNYEETILHAIERLNPKIKINEIRIAQLFNTRARVVFSDAPNNFSINDSVLVSFLISPEGMTGNSRFYISPNELTRPVPLYGKENLINNKIITNLGELSDNLPETILNQFIALNNNIDRNQISILNITTTSAIIIPNENSRYVGHLQIFFSLNYKNKIYLNKVNDNKKNDGSGSNSSNYQKLKKNIIKFNNLSKETKQQKLDGINKHYQTLFENDKNIFKNKLKVIGTSAIGAGISAVGTKITVSGSAISSTVSPGEATEMTSLLSEGGLTAAETLSVTEGTALVATEGTVVGAEVGAAVALAPETIGLSLVIGGLVIAGTAIIWWLISYDGNNIQAVVKHESHNQYNEIEKYYKFLAHDQLKLSINIDIWKKIKQIYQENKNNFEAFSNKIKSEITSFHKEDHSGWGGSITDDDINILIKIMFNNFEEINNHFTNSNYGWKIITNTVGNYFIIEEE